MADASERRGRRRGGGGAVRPRGWCCSFAGVPPSPDHRTFPTAAAGPAAASPAGGAGGGGGRKLPPKSPSLPSFHSSPTSSRLAGLGGLIDPRRILSPGRVSPIDPEESFPLPLPLPPPPPAEEVDDVVPPEREQAVSVAPCLAVREGCLAVREGDGDNGAMDLQLFLRGRDGRCVVMELDSRVLCGSSAFFAAMVPGDGAAPGEGSGNAGKRIEVNGVENVEAFRSAVELMYEPDPVPWLSASGVSRAIDVLEVSSSIIFDRGIKSCLTYIEAVPWSENDEEKLKNLFERCTFDEATSQDVLARLRPNNWCSSDDLIVHLIQSVTSSTNSGARKDMQSLVNGLLSKSSVYQKDLAGLNKQSLYHICYACLTSLVDLFDEATESTDQTVQTLVTTRGDKPLIERISRQAENLNWLLEILVNSDMAEEFVELWAKQDRLIRMHEQASPMIRYELSRISAGVFVTLGKGKVQCRGELRSFLFYGWFGPMLLDFGWLQRCSKGLDVRSLEENLGQALLTLPLKQQQCLFEEWFQCFASKGAECPNLTRAFQVWWRRSFVRSSVEARP